MGSGPPERYIGDFRIMRRDSMEVLAVDSLYHSRKANRQRVLHILVAAFLVASGASSSSLLSN